MNTAEKVLSFVSSNLLLTIAVPCGFMVLICLCIMLVKRKEKTNIPVETTKDPEDLDRDGGDCAYRYQHPRICHDEPRRRLHMCDTDDIHDSKFLD